MKLFKIPDRIYFEPGAVQYLAKMPDIHRVMIVAEPETVKLGYVERIVYQLNKNLTNPVVEVFKDITPEVSIDSVKNGTEAMKRFKPDVVVAAGGNSAMDSAKAMIMLYEDTNTDFDAVSKKFFDIPDGFGSDKKVKMVSVSSAASTGSEITSFAVVSDKGKAYPLANYKLSPDITIVDVEIAAGTEKAAETGLDILAHAFEAYTSIRSSDYTDAFAIHTIKMILDYLPRFAEKGESDFEAADKMHNASCMAGMAFSNAYLGINSAMANSLCDKFEISHGLANGILLPFVISYNGKDSDNEKYSLIASELGLPSSSIEESIKSLAETIRTLIKKLNLPISFKAAGITESVYMSSVDELADKALASHFTPSNPVAVTKEDILDLYKAAYQG